MEFCYKSHHLLENVHKTKPLSCHLFTILKHFDHGGYILEQCYCLPSNITYQSNPEKFIYSIKKQRPFDKMVVTRLSRRKSRVTTLTLSHRWIHKAYEM